MSTIINNLIGETYDECGLPLSWRDVDIAGLKDARLRYVSGLDMTADQVKLLAHYCAYYAAAPAWRGNVPGSIASRLGDCAYQARDQDALASWHRAAAVAGMDPLETGR